MTVVIYLRNEIIITYYQIIYLYHNSIARSAHMNGHLEDLRSRKHVRKHVSYYLFMYSNMYVKLSFGSDTTSTQHRSRLS